MSGISRVTTSAQQTQSLLNLLRNEQQLNDVLLQQSTGLKAPTYAGVASQAGQLLNVTTLSSQAQGFLNNISSAQTRLSLTDTTLSSIGQIATNFQQELQQLQSSPTPPNISDLARTSLAQLASLLDSSDGSQFLFAGGQQNAAPVSSVNTTRIPTTTLSLSGNLDTSGTAPINGNVAPPAPGSFVDTTLTGQNAVFDSNGQQYDTTVRYVHQSANQWQAYLVGFARSDDNSKTATYNGKPISASNPVAIGAPFDPSVSPPFNQVGNTTPGNALSFDNLGTTGIPQIALPTGGGTIAINVDANNITNTAGVSTSQMDNATATSQIVLNQLNLDPTTPVGDSTTITLSGADALFATGATGGSDKLNATIQLTKTQAANNNVTPPLMELWQASVISLKDAATGADVAEATTGANAGQPISATNPYVIGNFQPGQIPFGNINIGASGSAVNDAAGTGFDMLGTASGSLSTALRAGTVTTDPTGTTISQFTLNPLPPPGTPQELEVSANLSSATPVNISVATPTAGSFADISFNNSQALVDSGGNAHNLTMRFVKVSTGPDMYQAYAISLKDVESGNDATNPPVTAANPIAIGSPFDPTSPPSQLTFSPPLVNGTSLNVTIPLTSSTFTTTNSTIVLTDAENTSTAASSKAAGALNFIGNLSSSATGIPSGATLGAVTSLSIANAGTGYASGDTIAFNTPSGGTPAEFTVDTADPVTGAILTGHVSLAGSGYTSTPTIASTNGAGTGATINVPLDGPSSSDLTNPIGALAQVAGTMIPIATGGAGYNGATTIVTFPPPPNGGVTATGTATVVAGVVTQITITDPGSGYLTTPLPTITDTSGAGSGVVNPTAADLSLVAETPNNTADLHLFGQTAIRDSNGKAYDAVVRMQYSTSGLTTGWRATLVSLTDPATGQTPTGVTIPQAIGAPPFDAFNAKDAAHGPITIPADGPQVINLAGGATLSLTLPFNSENFSATSAATNLAVGGAPPSSLSSGLADTTYFQPGGKLFDTSQSQLQFRTAVDSVVSFGVRADDPAFEQLYRVLNFFKDQSVPANPTEIGNANQLINSSITGINALRANVANTQTVLKSEQNYHQTTINLASTTKDGIITADSATTAMNLNAISNLLQESFATLGVIKSLSLVNFLK